MGFNLLEISYYTYNHIIYHWLDQQLNVSIDTVDLENV